MEKMLMNKQKKGKIMEEKNINRNRLETDLLRISGVYESTLARIKKESEEEENTSGNNIKPYKISIFKRILMFFQGRKEEIDEKRNEVLELQSQYRDKKIVLSDLSDEQIEKMIFLYNKQIEELNKK